MTIVTLTRFPVDDELRVREHEVEDLKISKKVFDKIVNAAFGSSIIKAAYLVDNSGRMVDSYIK